MQVSQIFRVVTVFAATSCLDPIVNLTLLSGSFDVARGHGVGQGVCVGRFAHDIGLILELHRAVCVNIAVCGF